MYPYLTFIKQWFDCNRVNKMSREEVKTLQLFKLRKIAEFALEHCQFYASFYKKAGITKENIAKMTLEDFPMTNKKILKENFDQIVTDKRLKLSALQKYILDETDPRDNYLGRYKILHTSGTTGTPTIYPIAIKEMAIVLAALVNRVSPVSWKNLFKKKKIAYYAATHGHFTGVSYLLTAPKATIEVKIISILDPLPKVIEALNAFQPDELAGYASSMEILSEEKKKGTLKIHPRRIVCGGDPLFDYRRKKIFEAFKVQACDSYSTTEGMAIANQLDGTESLSVFDDLYILETEPRTCITNLYNHTFPIIRFENEDIVKSKDTAISDKNPFSKLERIDGRDFDTLEILNNAERKDTIHSAVLAGFYVEGIEKFQFWQKADHTILIKVIGKGENLEEKIHEALFKILKEKNAEKKMRISIEMVENIGVDPKSGKFKLVNQEKTL